MGGGDDEGWGDMDIRVSYPDSQLLLINVWEELVLKKCEVGGVLLYLNPGCLRERPQLPDKKILAGLWTRE